jgi:hypothetical protein
MADITVGQVAGAIAAGISLGMISSASTLVASMLLTGIFFRQSPLYTLSGMCHHSGWSYFERK